MTIRPAIRTDQAYVSQSWACSVLGPPRQWGPTAASVNAEIDACLDDKRTRVLVACDDADTHRILGWVAFARIPGARVLEQLVVRKEHRGGDVERELLTRAELLGPGVVHLYELPRDVAALIPNATKIEPREFLT